MKGKVFKAIFCAAIVAAIAFGVWGQRESFQSLEQLDLTTILVAAAICLVYRLVNSLGWWGVLRSLGVKTGLFASSRVWLVSEASRWLPGSVWNLVSRTAMARSIGVAPAVAAVSVTLELLLTIFAWSATASLLLFHSESLSQLPWLPRSPLIWLATLLGTLAFLIAASCCVPGIASRFYSKCSGFVKGIVTVHAAKPRPLLAMSVTGYYICLCLLHGCGFWFLAATLAPAETLPLSAVVGANAIAWLIGFFAVFSPGGLLVREGVIVLVLTPWLDPVDAAIAATAWRAIQIVIEIACLAACLAIGSVARKRVRLSDRSKPHATLLADTA